MKVYTKVYKLPVFYRLRFAVGRCAKSGGIPGSLQAGPAERPALARTTTGFERGKEKESKVIACESFFTLLTFSLAWKDSSG